MRLARAATEITTPAKAASCRVRGYTSPAMAATDAAALARNSGPIQRTPWTTEAYCWMWTAASPGEHERTERERHSRRSPR